MFAGVLLGVVALLGIPKYGTNGILVPALAGILMISCLIFVFVTNFLAARARAQGMRTDAPHSFTRHTPAASLAVYRYGPGFPAPWLARTRLSVSCSSVQR